MGAKDYLVKPIRLNECKALVSRMKKSAAPLSSDGSSHLAGLSKFEQIRELGRGASGSVLLVRNKIDGVQYALK